MVTQSELLTSSPGSNPIMPLAKAIGAKLMDTDWDSGPFFEAVGTEAEPHQSTLLSDGDVKRMEKLYESMMNLFEMKQRADEKDRK